MDIEKGCIYILKDEFYKIYDKEQDLVSNKRESRPHYYCFKKEEINWIIPLSSEIEKYKKIMEKDISQRGSCNKFVFAKIGYKKEEAVLLIQNIFPVTDKYFLRPYEINKLPCRIEDKNILKEINSKATQILKILESGKYFLKSQQKIIDLKQELIKELNIESKKNKEIRNMEVKSKKIEFSNEITGKTIYVELKENEYGKEEIRASHNIEPFRQEIGSYIKYNNIGEAAIELINNGFKAVKEINIEEKKLDDEFNKQLKEKIKKMEIKQEINKDIDFDK